MSIGATNTDPTWQNSGLTNTELNNVATALGYSSIDDPNMPAITELSSQNLYDIGLYTDPAVVAKLASYVNDVVEPTLDPADAEFDASDMLMAMAELNKELGELGITFAKEGVTISKEKLQEASKERIGKLKKAIKKMTEASNSSKIGKIFGWIGAGLAIAAAIVAVVLTGGAAIALVGLAIAAVSMIIMGLEEGGVMEKAYRALGEAFGLEGKKLDDFVMGMQIAVMAVLMIASICTGVGVAKALQGVDYTIKTAAMLGKIAQATAVLGAAASIGSGSAGIAGSVQGYEATEAMAKSKEFMAWIIKHQADMDQQTEELEKLMEKLQSMAFTMPKEMFETIRDGFLAAATAQGEASPA